MQINVFYNRMNYFITLGSDCAISNLIKNHFNRKNAIELKHSLFLLGLLLPLVNDDCKESIL